MQRLLVSLLLLVAAGARRVFSSESDYDLTYIRMCLKPEFLHYPDVAGDSEIICASACIKRGRRCQGFRLLEGRCQTLEFDSCSHMVNVANCSQFAWAFVRKQENLPSGQLCPPGYGYNYMSSTYKIFDVASWTEGHERCSSEVGLTKYADAMDSAETAHLHVIKYSLSPLRGIFVGGRRISGTWKWQDCNVVFLPEVWGPGQPNNGADWADVWSAYPSGIDDTPHSWTGLTRVLCECVNPFV